ncbi:MAG: AAA family ATPase [Ignavibacteriae bacterium]|nr:AAA family ATPase [Ignavibacteriota bacterium]
MLKSILQNDFSRTQENEMFREFKNILQNEYGKKEDYIYLIGNIIIKNGPFRSEIDAILLKKNAVIIIDFKDNGGKLNFSLDEDWKMEDNIVKGGSHKNPFHQIRSYKANLYHYLDDNKENFLNKGNVQDFTHINGLVLFRRNIVFDRNELPGKIRPWFHICDMNTVIGKINDIASPKINIEKSEYENLLSLSKIDLKVEESKPPVVLTPVYEQKNVKNTTEEKILDYYMSCLEQEQLKQLQLIAKKDGNGVFEKSNNFRYLNGNIYELFSGVETELNAILNDDLKNFIDRENQKANPRSLFCGYSIFSKSNNGNEYIYPAFYCQLKYNTQTNKYERSSLGDCFFNKALLLNLGYNDREEIESISNLIDSLGLFEDKIKKLKEIISSSQNVSITLNSDSILFFSETSSTIYNLLKELGENGLSRDFVINRLIMETPAKYLTGNLKPINNKSINSPFPILEIFRLNNSQEEAVSKCLNNDFTVITGPPGTGKSQVILNIIANAVYENKTVLFASKNNKAVDVVIERMLNEVLIESNLRNTIIRLGNKEVIREEIDKLVALSNQLNDQNISYESETINGLNILLKKVNEEINIINNNIADSHNYLDKIDYLLTLENVIYSAFFNREKYELGIEEIEFVIEEIKKLIDSNSGLLKKILIKLFKFCFKKKYFNKYILFKSKLPVSIRDYYEREKSMNMRFSFQDLLERIDYLKVVKQTEIEIKKIINFILEKIIVEDEKLFNINEAKNLIINYIENQKTNLFDKHSEKIKLSRNIFAEKIKEKISSNNFNNIITKYISNIRKFNRIDGEDIPNDQFSQFMTQWEENAENLVKNLPVWTVTSLSARNGIPLKDKIFDLLVIDEASQCDIPSAIPLFYRAKKICILGDDMQLRHIPGIKESEDKEIAVSCGISAIGGRYTKYSLYDISEILMKKSNERIYFLDEHFRSHENIMKFSNEYFYLPKKGREMVNKTIPSTLIYPKQGIFWVDVIGGDEVIDKYNKNEIDKCIELYKHLKKNQINDETTYGIATPFRNQANKIAKKLIDVRINTKDTINVLGNTVHVFQGDERDLILLSLVVSNNATLSMVNFINYVSIQLLNVGISRGRSAVFVVGDKKFCKKSGGLLKNLADYTEDYSF